MNSILNILISLYFSVYFGGITHPTPLYTSGLLVGGEFSVFSPDTFDHLIVGLSTSFYGFKDPYYEHYRRQDLNIMKATANFSALSIGYLWDFTRGRSRWGWELATGASLISYDLTFPEADINLEGTIVPTWGGSLWVRAKLHKWERGRASYGLWSELAVYKGAFEALYPVMGDSTWSRVDRGGGPVLSPMVGLGVTLTIKD